MGKWWSGRGHPLIPTCHTEALADMEGLSLMQGHVETDFASGKNQWGMCVSNIKLQTLDGTCVNQSLGVKLYLLLVFFVFLPLFETKIG